MSRAIYPESKVQRRKAIEGVSAQMARDRYVYLLDWRAFWVRSSALLVRYMEWQTTLHEARDHSRDEGSGAENLPVSSALFRGSFLSYYLFATPHQALQKEDG